MKPPTRNLLGFSKAEIWHKTQTPRIPRWHKVGWDTKVVSQVGLLLSLAAVSDTYLRIFHAWQGILYCMTIQRLQNPYLYFVLSIKCLLYVCLWYLEFTLPQRDDINAFTCSLPPFLFYQSFKGFHTQDCHTTWAMSM